MSGDQKKPFEVVFVLGGPGSGKGTQCAKIVEKMPNWAHLSAGDLLRIEQADVNSKVGEAIKKHMIEGTIVPAVVTCGLLKKAMEQHKAEKGIASFLIDGFPRNHDNLSGWNEIVAASAETKFVLHFVCPDDVCVARCKQRGLSSNRLDDNDETLKRRLIQFQEQCRPIIEHFRKLGLVRDVDSSPGPDEVFKVVEKLFS